MKRILSDFPICALARCEARLLHEQMMDERQRRGYGRKTIQEYNGSLRRLASYFGCCPLTLTLEQVREYQVHLAQRKEISTSYYNATVTALRFMYSYCR